ncbi:MAG: DUF134 domain-containing protein, partial [Desulfovibrionales bacterium]
MPRPKKCRLINYSPRVTYFKPRGIPLMELAEAYLPLEGVEALRLADQEGLSQEDAAARMDVSRHTFGRILSEARRIVAEVIVEGMALRIEGGDFALKETKEQIPVGSFSEKLGPDQGQTSGEENGMKKIAISSEGPGLDDAVDPRFGRAGGYVLVDPDTMQSEYIDNGQSQAMAHGAGIQAAETIARSGAGVVLTGSVGPKAFQVLSAAGVEIGQNLGGITVREAVEKYKKGEVSLAQQPNSPGQRAGRGLVRNIGPDRSSD